MQTTINTLNTSQSLFMVTFNGVSQKFLFNSEPEVLGNLIQTYGKHGIMNIKRLDTAKDSFKSISKKEIELFFGWDTHTIEQLKSKNFIK